MMMKDLTGSSAFVSRSIVTAAFFLSLGISSADKIPITISYQPATWWSLPVYMAEKNGYFDELGLNVSILVYPSGAPQVAAAVENQAWDIGAAGSVPCIIGGTQGLVTAGISNNEGGANAVVGNADATWPFTIDDTVKLAVTPNSTGQYAFNLCLESIGIIPEDHVANFIYGQQGDVMDAIAINATTQTADANYGGLWAPNIYTVLDGNPGSAILCTGDDVGAPVPGGIMIRQDFADGNLETVKKALAGWMRGIGWIKNPDNRAAVIENMAEFYATFGIELSNSAMEQEIDTRPLFDLEEQLDMMDRGDDESGTSTLDTWFNGVAEFMFAGGVIPEIPASNAYISDEYMQAVYDDEELRAFALAEKEDTGVDSKDGESTSQDGEGPDVSSGIRLDGLFGMIMSSFCLIAMFI